jgi:hypothetical protein
MKQKKHILFVCGSKNQTTQMHAIARYLPEYEHAYTPYYCDGYVEVMRKLGMLESTVAGGSFVKRTYQFAADNDLHIDHGAKERTYDLVVNCSDLNFPKNIRHMKNVLVQEGMTDPENFLFHLWQRFQFLPRWIGSTSTFGLSHNYEKLCAASPGYRDHFVRIGCNPDKIVVTGIPNFDNCRKFLNNSFPYHHYVLVCTSDARETWKIENRKELILRSVKIAAGRQLIFKLHPNEVVGRAVSEIKRYAPDALIYTSGSAEEMIANCDVLITRFSSTIYVGLALGKEVYSDFDISQLRKMTPIQNNCSAELIANVCREILEGESATTTTAPRKRTKVRTANFAEIATKMMKPGAMKIKYKQWVRQYLGPDKKHV